MKTTEQALKQQAADTERDRAVALQTTTTPAAINTGLEYLARDASSATVLRFSKDGQFVCPTDGDRVLPEGTELACHWDQARTGYQRFNGKGEPPDVRMDLVFGGKLPEREELGDVDASQWAVSDMTGKPEDPWRKVYLVPLESIETGEIFVFQTMSKTGRRSASNLLRQAARMAAKDPSNLPVIKLRMGGYDDRRFGWVKVPAFEFVGRAPKSNVAAAATSVSADLDDELPPGM
jgi:hypothetical protein